MSDEEEREIYFFIQQHMEPVNAFTPRNVRKGFTPIIRKGTMKTTKQS